LDRQNGSRGKGFENTWDLEEEDWTADQKLREFLQ